jgi:hypothetical protein
MIRSDVDAHAPSLEVGCDTLALGITPNIILAADAGCVPHPHDGIVQPVLKSAAARESTADSPSSVLSTRAVVLVALAVAALVGQLTPIGERILPESLSTMANSSGAWAMIVIASVYFSRLTGWRAAVLALGSFVVMDVCFYAVFDLLGGYYPHHYMTFWIAVAVCIGPLVGLCASWLRSDRVLLQEIAVAAPSAILVGEGIFMLVRLPDVSVLYAIVSVVVGVALFVALSVAFLRRPSRVVGSLIASVLAGSAFFGIYSLLPLVLGKVVP